MLTDKELRMLERPFICEDPTYCEAVAKDEEGNRYAVKWEITDYVSDDDFSFDKYNPVAIMRF